MSALRPLVAGRALPGGVLCGRALSGRSVSKVLLAALLVVLLLLEALLLRAAVARTYHFSVVIRYELPAIAIFLLALTVLSRCGWTGRLGARVVLAVGAVFQLMVILKPPVDSDDDFRYLWDARVQLSGVDPYRYAPSSPALAHLRDGYLFPTAASCAHYAFPGGCTRLNLPTVHTIYPPIAEAMFDLIRVLSFGGLGHQFPMQLAAAIGSLVIGWLLARRVLAQGLPLWLLAVWAWCPVMIMEFSNNAHIDWLGVLLAVLALSLSRPAATDAGSPTDAGSVPGHGRLGRLGRLGPGRLGWAGVLLGAAFATKLYPGMVGVSMLKRRPVVVVAAAVGTVALVYLPHVLAVGGSVIGYLPSYLNSGGFASGHQYRLVNAVLPTPLVTPAAVLIVVAVLVWAMLRSDPAHPERTAVVVVGVSMLVTTAPEPWYAMLLLALTVLSQRPEWLAVVIAPTVAFLANGNGAALDPALTYSFGASLVVVAAVAALRWRMAARRRTGRPAYPLSRSESGRETRQLSG